MLMVLAASGLIVLVVLLPLVDLVKNVGRA